MTAPKPATGEGDELAKLRAHTGSLAGKNHFQVLGVQETASSAQIKTAYFQLAKLYHPDTVPQGAPAEIGKLKANIFAAVNDSYKVLGSDQSRADYVEELKAGSPEQLDVARIMGAEEAFQKGCILVKARKFPEAVAMLDDAIKLNDKEGEYFAWRGFARFVASSDKAAGKTVAVKELEAAIKMNPKAAMSYYFMGQLLKLTGDAPGAEKWFKKTLAADPNHVDAQRELRLAAGRK